MNILLIAIDTLRADHLGCYGYFRDTSPVLDRLAREGVLFENFYAAGVPTGPGFTSIITGLYPINHGYYITPWNVPNTPQLDDDIPVLAEILWDHGYTTAAFDNLVNFRSHPKHFVRGYEFYVNVTKSSRWVHHHVTCREVNSRLLPWIRRHSYEKFFLFVHYWDPHMPYNQSVAYRKLFRHRKGSLSDLRVEKAEAGYDYVQGWGRVGMIFEGDEEKSIDLYDGEISYVDSCVGEVLSTLKEENVLDDTAVIVTSDHGEQLGQHGVYGHAGLHESVIKVPLIMWYPRKMRGGQRVESYYQHVGILPTILDLAGVEYGGRLDGASYLRLREGWEPRFVVVETWGERAIVEGDWKLIVHYKNELMNPGEAVKPIIRNVAIRGDVGLELYNIGRDPMETENLADSEVDIARELWRKLERWVRNHIGDSPDPIFGVASYTPPQPGRYQRLS